MYVKEFGKHLPHNLDKNGFVEVKSDADAIDVGSLADLRNFINGTLNKVTAINKNVSSYGLKHICEDFLGKYVSNGELIAAMILCNFDYKRISDTSPNAYFNVSMKDVNKLSRTRPRKK